MEAAPKEASEPREGRDEPPDEEDLQDGWAIGDNVDAVNVTALLASASGSEVAAADVTVVDDMDTGVTLPLGLT